MVDMANHHAGEYQINMFVPDLHSFTTPINHRELYKRTINNVRIFVAAGLDINNPNLYLYRQSHISAHSELTWILDCFTGFGEMSRMTQFKDKSAKLKEDRISVGLFNYPVLMAADILLYGAAYVPVGEDQTQHLEFARDIAERMNRQFSDVFPDGLFVVPQPVSKQHAFFAKDQDLRIRDLLSPATKMSKSDETGNGVIFLSDDPEAAAKKIMRAETDSLALIPDSLDYQKQPGISNLLQILALLEHTAVNETLRDWSGKTSYGELKSAVAEKVRAFLEEFQARLSDISDQEVEDKLHASEEAMRAVADKTLHRVQQAVGLRSIDEADS